MINTSTITKSLQLTFQSDATLLSLGFMESRIQRGDYVNMDPNKTPWLGIYRRNVNYNPRSLGKGSGKEWSGKVELKLLVQASSIRGGDQCEDLLESYVAAVLDSVWEDPTWTNVVDMVTDLNVEYSYKEDDTETIYFQWAMISISAEVSTG